MASIEQAVFTSARTDQSAGYQLIARSPGIGGADARELSIWGPSHDSLLATGPEAASLNFHPLPSGAFCVSRTTRAGWEYSDRGEQRVYTQCLVVPADVLAAFANNPFAVLRAALARGDLTVLEDIPSQLEPLQISARSPMVDSRLLSRLATDPGTDWLATLVQAALHSTVLALAKAHNIEYLIAGMMNCLPPECRTEFSFSTGLKPSVRRPFRVMAVSDNRGQWQRLRQQNQATVLVLSETPPAEFAPIDGWARFIQRVLESGRFSLLATQFAKRRFELTTEDLPALGLQLLEALDFSSLPTEPPSARTPKEPPSSGDWYDGLQRADAPHQNFQNSAQPVANQVDSPPGPSTTLEPDSPEVLQKLEHLDDLVFEAIAGKQTALEQLQTYWPEVCAELGTELLAKSREQYLRHALSIWEDSVDPAGLREPSRAMQALDVLCVLFDEA